MRVQGLLGSDVAMVLDECPPGGAPRPVVEAAMRRTTAIPTSAAPAAARSAIAATRSPRARPPPKRDRFEHQIELPQHLLIPKSQHMDPLCLQPRLSLSVVGRS